jgi:hypothetical protein
MMQWPKPRLDRLARVRPGLVALVAAAFLLGWMGGRLTAPPALAPPTVGLAADSTRQLHDTTRREAPGVVERDSQPEDPRRPTYVEMRNVLFHVHPDVALRIRSLHGTMRSLTRSSSTIRSRSGSAFTTPKSRSRRRT